MADFVRDGKAPLAGDLRLIAVTMKISQNLERVGDEAEFGYRIEVGNHRGAKVPPFVHVSAVDAGTAAVVCVLQGPLIVAQMD
jgi:hypothetical protein